MSSSRKHSERGSSHVGWWHATILAFLVVVSAATVARAADNCAGHVEVVSVTGGMASAVGPGGFTYYCRDDKTLASAGSFNSSCSAENNTAQASITVPSASETMIISGTATATAGKGVIATANAWVQIRVRAVGGPIRISSRLNGDAVGTALPLSTRNEGEEQQLDFGIQASIGLSEEGSQTHSGSVTITVEPVNGGPATTFTWADPAGGSYSDAKNWDPECGAPPRVDGGRSDTALFGLGTSIFPIAIDAGGGS